MTALRRARCQAKRTSFSFRRLQCWQRCTHDGEGSGGLGVLQERDVSHALTSCFFDFLDKGLTVTQQA